MIFSSLVLLSLIVELLSFPLSNSRGVGALRFRGEVRVHKNNEGTAFGRKDIFPEKNFLSSYSLKCLEQTFVDSFTLKCFPSSCQMAWIHFFLSVFLVGNLKWETAVVDGDGRTFSALQ